MFAALVDRRDDAAIPVVPLAADALDDWLAGVDERTARWVRASGFRARPATWCAIPDAEGGIARVLAGVASAVDPWSLAHLPAALSEGVYAIEAEWSAREREQVALGWALAAYRFDRYKKMEPARARLALDGVDAGQVGAQASAIALVRDLVNTPAGDMMPEHLAAAAESLAGEHGAAVEQVVGDDLLARDYPAIHAVGRASAHAPRLIDLRWGAEGAPRVTLVGKGVCFDSGGLDLKTAAGMRLMKKDMGGAAHALGLASLVMETRLPVRLRVLIAAVENAVSGNAFRPGDVLATRKGLTIEVENTDAEGRIVLADALAEACTESPDVLVDFATLTGAARVALGTDVPAMFANDDALADGLLAASREASDPLWRLPLHAPYRDLIDSTVADIANGATQPYAGAITAALFLQAFVDESTPWAHFDLMAWNPRSRPGRPEGGEAMALRAVYAHLRNRFAAR